MYGLVNQAIKDLVVTKFGEDSWKQICERANVPPEDFVSMQYYPDTVTYGLVGSASTQLNMDASDILFEFGKFWILYTASQGYGPLMDLFGEDFKSCLQSLNNMHARMGMTMPQLTPPRFRFTEIQPNLYQLDYFSKRAGLSPMVKGLLHGLAEKYSVKIQIIIMGKTSEAEQQQSFQIMVVE